MQKRILLDMLRNGGIAEFGAGKRSYRSYVCTEGHLVIHAYQTPQFFLSRTHKLIEPIKGTSHSYTLTPLGTYEAKLLRQAQHLAG